MCCVALLERLDPLLGAHDAVDLGEYGRLAREGGVVARAGLRERQTQGVVREHEATILPGGRRERAQRVPQPRVDRERAVLETAPELVAAEDEGLEVLVDPSVSRRRIRQLLYEEGFTISGARHRLDQAGSETPAKNASETRESTASLRKAIKGVLDALR